MKDDAIKNDTTKPYLTSNGSGTVDYTPAAVKARIAAFCRMLDLEAPALKVHRGKVHMTDELLAWCDRAGASLDWILLGDARALVACYREKHAPSLMGVTEFTALLSQLSRDDKLHLLDCMKAYRAGEVTQDEATARFREGVEQRRTASLPA